MMSVAGMTLTQVTCWVVLGLISSVGHHASAQHQMGDAAMPSTMDSNKKANNTVTGHTIGQGKPGAMSDNSTMAGSVGHNSSGSEPGSSQGMDMDMDMPSGGDSSKMMKMPQMGAHYGSFHITYQTVILFEQWVTSTWQGFLGSCFGVGLAAMLYEGLKVLKTFITRKFVRRPGKISVKPGMIRRLCSCSHLLQALLHVFQMVYSYLLMLVFMTFNLWLCVAIAIGFGVGYLLFREAGDESVDDGEHCMSPPSVCKQPEVKKIALTSWRPIPVTTNTVGPMEG